MNKPQIKNFSVWARRKLIETVSYRMSLIGITENGIAEALPQSTADLKFYDIGTATPAEVKGKDIIYRNELAAKVNENGFNNTVEEIAYTWFNRLIAIRFMEVNDYLPSRVRVLSSLESGKNEPDIITDAVNVASSEGFDITADEIYMLKDENKVDELFGKMFLFQCKQLSECLPELFEKTADYMNMLLPVSYTDKDGIIRHLVDDIPEDDFNLEKEGQVEIIGWLYQYYNTESNELVYDGTLSKAKIPKELISAATTIYTPHWAVKYMVENSLGRLWIEGHNDSSAKSEWKYYLEEAEQEESVKAQLEEIRSEYKNLNLEEIKFIDPCMGSGHILVYAFDVLMQIYASCGYSERDAAQLIMQKNLHGLDIDRRAYQLAYFALMMKARQYDRRFLTRGIKPNLAHFQGLESIHTANVDGAVKELTEQFRDCDTYGSLTDISEIKGLDEAFDDFAGVIGMEFDKAERMMTIYKILSQKYDVVCTNPPYLGSSRFNPELTKFVQDKYSEEKSDLSMVMFRFAVDKLLKDNGHTAFVTTSSWFFLSSFEKLRNYMLHNYQFTSIVDYGTELFDGKVGHNPIVSWVLQKTKPYKAITAIRLVDYCYSRRDEKEPEYFNKDNHYTTKQENFSKIPGAPVAYWVSENFIRAFDSCKISEHFTAIVKGIYTGDNARFLRLWFEVCNEKFKKKWIGYSKGGEFRRWYGNLEYVINWENDAAELRNFEGSGLGASQYFGKDTIVWTKLTSYKTGFRKNTKDVFFDDASPALVSNSSDMNYYLALLNSVITSEVLFMISPTLNYQCGEIKKIPVIVDEKKEQVEIIAQQNITLSKTDWDSFETSWDFKRHPLIPTQNDDNTIHFCLKISQEKWIKRLQQGEICFTPTRFFIEEAIRKGNDEQGDFYEGVFAKLNPNDKRIDELREKLGSDLEIIEENGYVLLRRHSSKDIPIFCLYGIYDEDLQYIGEPQENPEKPGEYFAKIRIDIADKMYSNFLQDSDVWGFYASSGHFLEAIQEMLDMENVGCIKKKVNYTLFENEEFFIEPTDDYPELGYKFPKFAYQNEARIILNKHQKDRWVHNYTPLSDKSANITNCPLYMEMNAKCQKNDGVYISSIFEKWSNECDERFNTLKKNEEELNRIFIDIYGLQDELTPEVDDKDVTVRKADLQREIKSLISYAVGCMFGRYSLDRDGIVFAGGDFDKVYWKHKGIAPLNDNGEPIDGGYSGMSQAPYQYLRFKDNEDPDEATLLTFAPDADNCLIITDELYFNNEDIVSRFCEFIKVVYGEETLEENLNFIADALGNKGKTSREVIRNYFLSDFIKDHIKTYQKRPIYWLFDSGKQNGFKALVYMHRWNADTIGNVRVEYLHKVQKVYQSEIDRMQDTIENSTDGREVTAATKAKEKLAKQLKETRDYDVSMAHLANMRINIDLDDGVKVNYEKVQTSTDGKNLGVLAKI